jgi:hypothetical protein
MKRTLKFKSLLMITDFSGKSPDISYDMESVQSHDIQLRLGRFLLCRSWILNFFISLMAVLLIVSLVYGVLYIGMKSGAGNGGSAGSLFILFPTLTFFILWLSLGVPSALKRLKMDFVLKERGNGNWKIIDDTRWDNFCRMNRIAQERRKKQIREDKLKALGK